MEDRKLTLRSGTRKDYCKLNDVDVALEEESTDHDGDGIYACASGKNKKGKQKQHGEDGGEILNCEVVVGNSDDSENESVADETSDSDGELLEAELRLEALKKEEKLLEKRAKRARIAKETEEVEKSLQKLKKNGGAKAKKVTAASLRNMDDVMEEVDRLMDKNMKIKTVADSSTESESDVVSSSVSKCGSSTGRTRRKSKSRQGQEKAEKKSGKSKNSLNSESKFPQKWPHSFLNPHFVLSKEKSYEDLSISEFCAGYMTILENESEEKRVYRIAHLKELMYLSTRFAWKCVLDYHGACLLEIERGHLKWGDSFQLLQSTTLAGGFLVSNMRGGSGSGNNRSNANSSNVNRSEGIVFCKGYQRGTCQQSRDHYGQFYGQNRLLKHICGNWWLKLKTQASHPENSEECPLKQQL